jgi:diaminopimelate decarboxylase
MSSTYNSRPRCREVLVNNGKAELIRDSETVEDLWRHQIIPKRLLKK